LRKRTVRFRHFGVRWLATAALVLCIPALSGHAERQATLLEKAKFHERRPAIVQRTDAEQLQRLIAQNLIIDSVRGETLEAYVNDEEFQWIGDQGWKIEWVPDEELPHWKPRKVAPGGLSTPLTFYPTYEQLTNDLQILAASYPNLCRLESIGKSVENRDLWFLKITDNPDLEEAEPEFKYISTMHGDEPVGTVMTLNLIHILLGNYATDQRIRNLVDETEIWIMPLMNPDGYSDEEGPSRFNFHGVDLNRNFPDPVTSPTNTIAGRAPETQAVMTFGFHHSSVFSANLHTGALVMNYPFDYKTSPSPDDDVFVHVSHKYADLNPPMAANTDPSRGFVNGIVRGVLWFMVHGGMQDWNYLWLGCNEITIELSDFIKAPDESTLLGFWDDNRESMLAYMEQVHIGVRGLVTDADSGDPLAATVQVVGRDHNVFTDPDVGDYHRMLVPGTYDLEFSSEGYEAKTISGVEVQEASPTILDATLDKVPPPISMWRLR